MSIAEGESFPRLGRWMRRDRLQLEGLTRAGAELLEKRLVIRHRAAAPLIGALVATAVALGVAIAELPARRLGAGAWWWVAVATLMFASATTSVMSVVLRRADQRLAADLPRRVAGDHAVPVWRRVGAIRLASGLLVLAGSVVMFVGVANSGVTTSLVALYAVLLAAMLITTATGAWREISRPAIAVDEASLRVDDQWRARSVYLALSPLLLQFATARFFLPADPGTGPGWLRALNLYGWALILVVPLLETIAEAVDSRRLGRAAFSSR